ncbi:DNA polymerase V [Pantoea sp. BAV 3049]|uniref:DNA polymerase V n=1 Tax=Pantoea sp. BAV 3049 TaxID=2654188 RepID=UPI00131CC2AC|nr:DNA polymerase V [Pantoea sp. BAV 3049]
MARRYEIYSAFSSAICYETPRGQTVRASDFVRELASFNHHWTLEEASEWIGRYQLSFRLYAEHPGGDKEFFLMNMGRVQRGG